MPWSIWDRYEAGVREPGILWRYDAEERTFTVRFENALDLNDLEDVSWAEVLDDVPMAESDGEPASRVAHIHIPPSLQPQVLRTPLAAAVAMSRLRATPIIPHPLSLHARHLARPAHARASVCVLTL